MAANDPGTMVAPATTMADLLAGAGRQWSASLEYVEDFDAAHLATMRDPVGRARLTTAYQQAQLDGRARRGERCCGSTSEWHRPWCETEPRRYRQDEAGTVDYMLKVSLEARADGSVPDPETVRELAEALLKSAAASPVPWRVVGVTLAVPEVEPEPR